jgi:hypothetical protein
MRDALRAKTFSGAFWGYQSVSCNSDKRSMQWSARSGMVQPVRRSLRRNHGRRQCQQYKMKRSKRRCKRNGPEGVEPSTVDCQQSPENRGPARSPRSLRASARSRGATSGQKARNTEWVGRRPRLRLAGCELSRAVRREAVAGPVGRIPEQRYEGSAMYYSAGAAAGLNNFSDALWFGPEISPASMSGSPR